jgi:uncharacterized membrane protein
MKLDTSPEALAEDLLGRPFAELDQEERAVLRRVSAGEIIGLDADERAAAENTFGDRLADRVAAVGGSWGFICSFMLILLAWMLINSRVMEALGISAFDGYPYIFLNLMLSMLAALQAPIIMMSQNRQAKKDRVAARHDYEVNLRTTIELLRLHRKVDRLFSKLGHMENGSVHSARRPLD